MISIIIPLYNKAAYIAQAIASIQVPDGIAYEIVVVDDASTDDSAKVVQQLKHPHVRYIRNEKNIGLSATRNHGIAAAQYDYLAFLDADDYWDAAFVPSVLGLIEKFPQAGIWATAYWEAYGDGSLRATAKNLQTTEAIYLESAFYAQSYQPLYCYSSVVVHRRVFEQVGGFNPKVTYAEDVEFNLRALAAFGLAYSPKEACYYRTALPGQLTFTSISQRGLPDFDAFENQAKTVEGMKAYLDMNRYFIGKQLKQEGEIERAQNMWQPIDSNNLNWKMRLLMQLPTPLTKGAQQLKKQLLKWGIRWTSFA